MALNLSRNTKVYVSSVNGVPTTAEGGAQFLTGYIITVGSGYAEKDRINFGTTSGSGANLMGIVTSIDGSGGVTGLAIPGNGIGEDFVVDEAATESTAYDIDGDASSGTGCIVKIKTVGSTTAVTTNGSRTATGRFIGNTTNANTFRIGILDGYSFSQGSESTDVMISEAGATPNRGSKRFNDALPPAEWSFGTYVRPFRHGTGSWRSNTTYDMCENILWSALAGTGLADQSGAAVDTTATDAIAGNVTFTNSNVHELLKINIYFVLENTTYRLNDAQINTAEIDFAIDGIAQITWSGNATTIDQVTVASEDPGKYLTLTTTSSGTYGMTGDDTTARPVTGSDTYAESYNYADSTGPSDADYLRNKLSALYLDVNQQGGGSASQ